MTDASIGVSMKRTVMFLEDQWLLCNQESCLKKRAGDHATCRFVLVPVVVFIVVVEGEIVDDNVDNEVDDIIVETVLDGSGDVGRVLPATEMFEQTEK